MQPESKTRAVELVAENLKKLSRVLELKRLGGGGGGAAPLVELLVSRYALDAKCAGDLPLCLDVPERGRYRRVETFSATKCRTGRLPGGTSSPLL